MEQIKRNGSRGRKREKKRENRGKKKIVKKHDINKPENEWMYFHIINDTSDNIYDIIWTACGEK